MSKSLTRADKKLEGPRPGVTFLLLPPDGGYGWIVAIAGFFAMFLGEGTMYSFGLFIEEIRTDMDCTKTVMSIANSTMSGFYFVWGPVMCALINRFGYRIIGVAGAIIAASSFLGSSYLHNSTTFIIVFGAVGGIGFSMLYFSSVLIVAVYFERWRAVAISIALAGGTAGSMAIPQFIINVFKGLDWRTQFKYFAGITVGCGLVTLLYKPLQPFEIVSPDVKNPKKISPGSSLTDFLSSFPRRSDTSFFSIKRTRSDKSAKSREKSEKASIARQSVRIRVASTVDSQNQTCVCCKKCKCMRCRCYCDCETFSLDCYELCCCCKVTPQCCFQSGRPLNRADIFYLSSVAVLPEHKRIIESKASIADYHMSVTKITPVDEAEREAKCCICCPYSITSAFVTMLDLSILKIPSFTLVSMHSFLVTFGYYSPPIFITMKALNEGVETHIANLLLTTFGASALFGRILCVCIATWPRTNPILVTIWSTITCGLSIILNNVSEHYINHLSFVVVFGISGSLVYSMKTPSIVQLYGLERLSGSFGISMMMYGLAGFIGVPSAAYILDSTNNFKIMFYFIGSLTTMAGLVIIPVPFMRKREKAKEEAQKRKVEASKATTSALVKEKPK